MENKKLSTEEVFLLTIREYFESTNQIELSRMLSQAKIIFDYTTDFTYKRWNQCKCYIEIKVPVSIKTKLEEPSITSLIYDVCDQIYESDEHFGFSGIRIGILPSISSGTVKKDDGITIEQYSKNQIYQNLLSKIQKTRIDPIESAYIYEACHCAINGLRLAAATMLGCAAECLLSQLCNAYLSYLKNGNGTERDIERFENEAVNATKAHRRLDKFENTVRNQEELFKNLGLENSNLHFTFLDIIRQVRNESGHPTGIIISDEDLNTIFANYQLLIERVHPIITKLPTYRR